MEQTVVDLFRDSAYRYPAKTALQFYKRLMTYGELDVVSVQFATFLIEKGLRVGDRVVMILPNCPQFVIAYLGILRAGGVVAALNPLLKADEQLKLVQQTNPRFIISLQDFSGSNLIISKNLCEDQKLILVSLGRCLPVELSCLYRLKNLFKFKPSQAYRWDWLMRQDWHGHLPDLDSDSLAVLQFTGGTTGVPKAAKLTHKNLLSNALQATGFIGNLINKDSVLMGVIPFWHVFGLSVCLNIALAKGSKVILMLKFNANRLLKLMVKEKVTLFPSVPRIFSVLLKNRRISHADWSALRLSVSGAGALDGRVKSEFEKITGATIIEGYGLSEASPIVSINPVDNARPGSLGRLVTGTEAKIVEGELWVKGPQVMAGYWENADETAEVLTPDGWLKTGDMVRIDPEGFLWMEDRKKDLIKVRGENVYPKEIEEAINRCYRVQESAVVGVPDKDYGERIVACVVLKPEYRDKTSVDVLLGFCRDGLPKYKCPQTIKFFDELPKTILGKVLKQDLRKMLS